MRQAAELPRPAGSRRRADARSALRTFLGAVAIAAVAILLALALRDPGTDARPAGAAALAALASLAARWPLERVSRALSPALHRRLRDARQVADLVEGGVLALAALLAFLHPAWLAVLALALAGFLLMGALARLTLCAVLRRALDGADDPDAR